MARRFGADRLTRRAGEETRWVALDEVWDLTGKPDEFLDLVRNAVRSYLDSDA